MKTVNLVCESPFFKQEDFQVVEFYGKEVVAFTELERDFINNSVVYGLFDSDLKPLPYESGLPGGLGYIGYKRHFIQDSEIYIVLDKGTVGFESTTIISRCTIKETDTEFMVGIMMETNETAVERITEVFEGRGCGVNGILHGNILHKVSASPAPIPDIVKHLEQTPFLDISNNPCAGIPLFLSADGEFCLDAKSPYSIINNEGKITVGALLCSLPMNNAVEVHEIKGFAHSLYGDFFALVQTKYLYPRDVEAIKAELPNFYKEHCLFDNERRLREFIGTPESLAYIPTDSKIGDSDIYQELLTVDGNFGISNAVFQFTLSGRPVNFGDCTCSDSGLLPVAIGSLLGTLVEVNGQYKILFYKCNKVVKDINKHYVHFVLDDDSGFFRDFSKAGKSAFKKYQHRNACRNVEYLLCTGKISPVSVNPNPCI